MGKTIHDPNLRYSEKGKRLYGFWKRIHRNIDSPEFEQFTDFYYWAIANGYTDRARLYRYDREEPYSPENCFWVPVGDVAGTKEPQKNGEQSNIYYLDSTWMRKWDETVNRIRLHYGMEPIHSSEV